MKLDAIIFFIDTEDKHNELYTERDPYGMYRYTSGEKQGPGPELMGAHTLLGEDVYNTNNEDLGIDRRI